MLIKNSQEYNIKDIEKILRCNLDLIYPGNRDIKIRNSHRYLSLSKKSFVVRCEIELFSKKNYRKNIWISSSSKFSKEKNFLINKFLWEKDFKEYLAVVKPLCYLKDTNFFIYEDAPGTSLNDLIKNKDPKTTIAVQKSAQWLAKFYSVPFGGLIKDRLKLYVNWQAIEQKCLNFSIIKQKFETFFDTIQQDALTLIHGDFQPNNIILNDKDLYVIDFDLAALSNPLMDLAVFQTQMKLRCLELDDLNFYEKLDKIFFDQLRQDGYKFDYAKLQKYFFLVNVQAFSAVCAYLSKDKAHLKVFDYLQQEINKQLKEIK